LKILFNLDSIAAPKNKILAKVTLVTFDQTIKGIKQPFSEHFQFSFPKSATPLPFLLKLKKCGTPYMKPRDVVALPSLHVHDTSMTFYWDFTHFCLEGKVRLRKITIF